MLGVNDSSLIEIMTNENSFNQDPTKPVVFGGVVFENMQRYAEIYIVIIYIHAYFSSKSNESLPDLDYTLRLGSSFGQKFSEFLFFPYQFSGPQVNTNLINIIFISYFQPNGGAYSMFCALQTLIDLSYTQLVTGEQLLITTPVTDISDLLSLNISWVSRMHSLYIW